MSHIPASWTFSRSSVQTRWTNRRGIFTSSMPQPCTDFTSRIRPCVQKNPRPRLLQRQQIRAFCAQEAGFQAHLRPNLSPYLKKQPDGFTSPQLWSTIRLRLHLKAKTIIHSMFSNLGFTGQHAHFQSQRMRRSTSTRWTHKTFWIAKRRSSAPRFSRVQFLNVRFLAATSLQALQYL